MATKLYFHAASSTVAGTLPTTTQSGLTINTSTGCDAQSVNRSMNITKGVSQTSIALTSLADTNTDIYYFTKFVSPPLKATTISAQTWTYQFAAQESNAAANFPTTTSSTQNVTCYVWRPGGGGSRVGYILNSATGVTFAEASTSETAITGTFSGSSVVCLSGDVIVLEIIFKVTQGGAAARTDTFYYDGTTEASTTTNAAFLSAGTDTFAWYNPFTLTETKTISEVSDSTHNYRKAVPKVADETKTVSETQLRKPKPLVATQTIAISDSNVREVFRKLAAETVVVFGFIVKPEWAVISDKLLRKPIPKIAAEIKTISDGIARLYQFFRTLTETKTIAETLLRKPAPKIAAETKTISEVFANLNKFSRAFTETKTVSEALLRIVVPKLAAETKTISDALVRIATHFRTFTETKTISETLVAIAERLVHITETKTISEVLLRHIIRPIVETKSITESIILKHFLGFVETNTISEIKNASKIASEFVAVTDSKLRKVIPHIATETKAISDSIGKLLYFFRIITETKSISESLLRTVIPKITAETKSITETLLRTIIRPISQSSTISDLLSYVKTPFGVFNSFNLTETIAISDAIVRLANFFRDITENISISELLIIGGGLTIVPLIETLSIAESFLRKTIPVIATETMSITDSFLRTMVTSLYETVLFIEDITKDIFRYISQTVSISETQLRTFIPSVFYDTTAISDSIIRLSNHFKTLTQTITLTESKLRLVIPYLTAESKSIGDSILRSPAFTMSDSTDVSDSIDRLASFFRTILEYSAVMERVFGWLVGSIRRVVRIQSCN